MSETAAKVSFYDRLKTATKHRFAEPILAALCFLEAMIIPVFPEIMLAPMIIADRLRAWRLAAICTVASVAGGLAGYAIGYFLFDSIGRAIIDFYGAADGFGALRQSFNDNGPLMILIGALSPIPYKVITITSGVAGLDLWTFVIYGIIGRGLRYFVPCGLFYFFGPIAGEFIEKHKKWAGIGMVALVVVGFAMAPLLFPKAGTEIADAAIEETTGIDLITN
ncbi:MULTISPECIES: YqaA family protein [unclassified Devosia]|uniref:YqaA family protein n=1 Tax=unclassified Devosia TaxID=196773 RepID=UPI00145D886A|nr:MULTISPECIES: YqaA family protein [unclassified Devosia]MBJ6988790.1 DedA family protein [Devosia sp. MC521]MBJ7579240.1 DedA family protein [Devosia sp. MC532]MBK1796269.1 DedA family protein [Devosia sp. WQ 349K1]QMW63075.1 DedA family protein [Devosia sp. MC521]